MKQPNVQIIPATPGWSVVEPVRGDNGDVVDLTHEPVVAWAVEFRPMKLDRFPDQDGYAAGPAVPITPCGLVAGSDGNFYARGIPWVIRDPGGDYIIDTKRVRTKEEVVRYYCDTIRHELKRLAAKKANPGGAE